MKSLNPQVYSLCGHTKLLPLNNSASEKNTLKVPTSIIISSNFEPNGKRAYLKPATPEIFK